jgi:glycerol-3-phosphate cytidylyltransferase-like family protein
MNEKKRIIVDMHTMNGMQSTACISGSMYPVTLDVIREINSASAYGKVIIILNSNYWHSKNDKDFLNYKEREEILMSLKNVIMVDSVDDSDGTVCEALNRIRPKYFKNLHGERREEKKICESLGITILK